MKRFRTILALILTLSLAASIIAITTAETVPVEPWQADLRALMDDSSVPRSTSLKYDVSTPENAQTHENAVEKVNGSGLTMRIDFSMIAPENYTKDDWAQLDQWLEETASRTVQGLAADTENLAKALSDAVASGRKARFDAETAPAWTRDDWQLTGLTVTIPYYPELSEGVNGTATQRLQEKLAQYGFLDDKADGYFGAKTRAAVEMLERHVRELEQDLIDARPTPEPTPLPIPTPAPTETMAAPEDSPLAEEPTVEPSVEPEPTPLTPVDGVADALLQAYLYSGDFAPYRGTLQQGDQGDAVLRMQRRLLQLGCMTGAADGHYGGNTARSVRIFQYYNDLELTGAADAATLSRLFSEDAKAPENAMLTAGSSGEAVKALQLRLRVLGFMKGSVDGDYGSATVTGVENLQKYLRQREEAAVRADAETMARLEETNGSVESLLTVEVNGVADPILLDEFYSDAFPAIPDAMDSGADGADVVRLQRRLNTLEYYYGSLDGAYGAGTANAVDAFQKRNGLTRTGTADAQTMALLFSKDALKALKPYVLKISTADQRVYAYGLDANNEYTELVRTMKCSTGKDATPTPKGDFQNGTGPGARWHYFKKYKCWAQYAYYIEGDILFHSVLYKEKEGKVTQSSVNNLGRKASHGCVRLSVEDAKWIYNNCPQNTKVVVY